MTNTKNELLTKTSMQLQRWKQWLNSLHRWNPFTDDQFLCSISTGGTAYNEDNVDMGN